MSREPDDRCPDCHKRDPHCVCAHDGKAETNRHDDSKQAALDHIAALRAHTRKDQKP